MRQFGGMAWALTLGLTLSLIAGAAAVGLGGSTKAPTPTQDMGTSSDISMEPWPTTDALSTQIAREYPDDGGNVTIGLAVRWGYLDDPAVLGLEGRWQFNDTKTGGTFVARWHFLFRRIGGPIEGRFTLPADGNGQFRGTWTIDGTRMGGSLWGEWVRTNATHGSIDGRWNATGTRIGGALAGDWIQVGEDGGSFRGRAVAAPSIDPVDWDGSLHTTDGVVRVLTTVRFERGDEILPRTDRQTVAWNSTTTVNWDGIIFVLRIPQGSVANVTLTTTPASFEWTLRELIGLRVRERVDDAGHAIEAAGFLIGRPPAVDYARIQVGMRWGNLSSNGTDDPASDVTTWDGFAQVTYGGLAVERVLSFERGDAVLPRDNRVTVEWDSATTTGWDGLAVVAYLPLDHVDDTYFTLHAGSFTHVFTLRELIGDHTFDVGGGNQVEVRAVRG